MESALADGASRVSEDEEGDCRQRHDTEDGPQPVGAMSGQVEVGVGLRGG